MVTKTTTENSNETANAGNYLDKYVGKVIATRGYASGVNVGKLVHADPEKKLVILTEAYFLRNWNYEKSNGSMASLSSGDITTKGGEITRIHKDTILLDVGQFVICPESVLKVCEKIAK